MSERDYIETEDDVESEERETCLECGTELHAFDFDLCEECIDEMEEEEYEEFTEGLSNIVDDLEDGE
jgi:uncharacterized protein with PIN domain